jgi:hypothetical protein
MQAAVHNRRGVKSRGRLHQIPQLPAVGTEVKNLVLGTSNAVHSAGVWYVCLLLATIYCRLETGFMIKLKGFWRWYVIVDVTEILDIFHIVVPNYPQSFWDWIYLRFQMVQERGENIFWGGPLECVNINTKHEQQIRFFPFPFLPEDRGKFSLRNFVCTYRHETAYSVSTLRHDCGLCSRMSFFK